VLKQVLNEYDWTAKDFYRWTVEYSQDQLSQLILKRSGRDFGQILDMVPVERGVSGRLIKLKIVGSKKTLTVGKELEIRRWLSESHLYSSAFTVEKQDVVDGLPGKFILHGAGWGHGVGLCQIGAAVMGHKGYKYDEILHHYFKNITLEKRY
jgi:SpoIID/LytB domain protein